MNFLISISLLIVAVNCVFMWKLIKDFQKKPEIAIKDRKDVAAVSIFSFFQFILSFMGISNFASGSIFYSRIKCLAVKKLPGTLNASAAVPVSVMALFFVAHVQIDPVTLSVAIVMQTAGAFLTPHLVAKVEASTIRRLLALGLIIAAVKLFINDFQISESTDMSLQGYKLVIFGALCAFYGVLNNFGISSFTLTTLTVYIIGLNPVAALPIMTCAAAISLPLASMRFIKLGMASNSVAILSSVFGVTGVWFAIRMAGDASIKYLEYISGAVFAICFLAMMTDFWWKRNRQSVDGELPKIKIPTVSYFAIIATIFVIFQFMYDSYRNFSDLEENIRLMEMDSSVREMQELNSVKIEKIQTYLESSGKAILYLIRNKATLPQIEDYLHEASITQEGLLMLYFGSNRDYLGKKYMLISEDSKRDLAKKMNHSEHPWYKNAQKTNGKMTYSLHKDYFFDNLIMNFSTSVYDRKGKSIGVIGASFPVENLDKMLNSRASVNQKSFLIDSSGFFITNSDTSLIINKNFFEEYGLSEYKNSILKSDKHSRVVGNELIYFSQIPGINCFLVAVISLENDADSARIKELTTDFISSTFISMFFMILVLGGFLILLRMEISSHEETKMESLTDPLTGLANRRAFTDKIQSEWNRLARDRRQLSYLTLDADKFKSYNDNYGHAQGDELLKLLGKILKNYARRPGDIAVRLGGEEFGLLLPEINLDNAVLVAENLRKRIEQMRVPMLDGGKPIVTTVSIGVSTIIPSNGASYKTLTDAADEMLYKAKESGRNRVCWG